MRVITLGSECAAVIPGRACARLYNPLDKMRLDAERLGRSIPPEVEEALDAIRQAAKFFLTSTRPVDGQEEQAFGDQSCSLSLDQAAAIAGRDRRTLIRWIEQGLPAVKQAGRWLIARDDLETFIAKKRNAR